ncbi:pantoate--beta-alanine ligase, partial [bacterium]|nr:pantoate--beta-alanine ligase [bacterium]
REGERDSKKIIRQMKKLIKKEKLIKLEYVAITDPETLKEVRIIKKGVCPVRSKTPETSASPLARTSNGVNISLAAKIGKARLIDNITVEVS